MQFHQLLKTLLATSLAIAASPAQAYQYAISDLGTLGGNFAVGNSINDKGQVAGYSIDGSDPDYRATLWNNGVSSDLQEGSNSNATGINNHGQISGYRYSQGQMQATVWENGAITSLPTFNGGTYDKATSINNNHQVAGYSDDSSFAFHAALWENGNIHDLGTLGGDTSYGYHVNEKGFVVGESYISGNTADHATLWTSTNIIDLGTLGGLFSKANNINNQDQIVGQSHLQDNTDEHQHATLWANGSITDLGTISGNRSQANGINDFGEIVGDSTYTLDNNFSHATLWKQNKATDLNDLIDPVYGWTLVSASSINGKGMITGYGSINGETHAFLLTPVPESNTLAMILTGLGLLGFKAYRYRRSSNP